jgi:peptidoglycan DL-endopeptidase CwlO
VSDYLDREYVRLAPPSSPGVHPPVRFARSDYESEIDKAASRNGLDARLVRAIIASESGGDQAAVSSKGAVGLMQLMPETARELGVDPWDPKQNIAGATRYLAALLRDFGSLDASLIAYNAGPGFATRYQRGEVALYGETRAFVSRVRQLMQ